MEAKAFERADEAEGHSSVAGPVQAERFPALLAEVLEARSRVPLEPFIGGGSSAWPLAAAANSAFTIRGAPGRGRLAAEFFFS